jgi:predicted MPP superfamily phosphohydrolase
MAAIFLIFISLFSIDLITLFGLLLPRLSPLLRGWALLAGIVLAVIALFQGLRPPVIVKYEVNLPNLSPTLDGIVIVALSDMHLGSQLGKRWLDNRIAQVLAQQPDLVVLLGDIFEGHGPPQAELVTKFKQLSPPLGIWVVSGNHDFLRNDDLHFYKETDFNLLSNTWAEVKPGLVLAGVDNLTSGRRRGQAADPILKTLKDRPNGATILLSHTPWEAEKVAALGVGLMLSGHTHGGQIWPFDYLVRLRYPLLEGLYEKDGMTIIVSRGTGTWGPRMRLWLPSEILHITLHGKG